MRYTAARGRRRAAMCFRDLRADISQSCIVLHTALGVQVANDLPSPF